MKKVLSLLVALLVMISLIACDMTNEKDGTSSESASESVSESVSEMTGENETKSTAQIAMEKLASISSDFGDNLKVDANASVSIGDEASATANTSIVITESNGSFTITVPDADFSLALVYDEATDAIYATAEGHTVAITEIAAGVDTIGTEIEAILNELMNMVDSLPDDGAELGSAMDIISLLPIITGSLEDMENIDTEEILNTLLGQFDMTQEELMAIPGMQEMIDSLSTLQETEIFAAYTVTEENGVTTITLAGLSDKVYNVINSSMTAALNLIEAIPSENLPADLSEAKELINTFMPYIQSLTGEDAFKLGFVIDEQNRLTSYKYELNMPEFALTVGEDEMTIPAISITCEVTVTYGGQTVTVPTMPEDPEDIKTLAELWDLFMEGFGETRPPVEIMPEEGTGLDPLPVGILR